MKAFQHWFMAWIFPWVPKRLMSRAVGLAALAPLPRPLSGPVIACFARLFGIDVKEAEHPISTYRSVNQFFTRKLKPGARSIDGERVHPVDGRLTERGQVAKGQLVQAKNWTYGLAEFLGDEVLAKAFEGGQYLTYYLCPADYHRVHAPASGRLVNARHIPGLLWPVNEWSVHNIRRLFCLNERVVLNFEGEAGRWTMVMVGATNVGQISVTLDPSVVTNRWLWHEPTERWYQPPIAVRTGDEVGIFNLGSTVIVIFEKTFPDPAVGEEPLVTRVGGAI